MINTAAPSRVTESLGEILGRMFPAGQSFDPVNDWPLEQLIALASTDQLRAQRDTLAARFAEVVPDGPEPGRAEVTDRSRLGQRLQAAELAIRRGERRDALQSGRPENCWCLGIGGRRETKLVYYHGFDRDGQPAPYLVRDANGEDIAGFRDYCGCPEGCALSFRNAELAGRAASEHRTKSQAATWDGVGIPTRSADVTFDGWKALALLGGQSAAVADRVVAGLEDWLESEHWLVLWGPVGRGKTGLAAVLAKILIERGCSLLFRTVPDMLDRLRATYGADGEGREADLLAALYEVDVLVLDDVGVDGPTDWAMGRLFRIVNQRYDAGRRTILTTNLDQGQLAKYLGVRNFDRLRQMAGPVGFVHLAGPNLRDQSNRQPARPEPRSPRPVERSRIELSKPRELEI